MPLMVPFVLLSFSYANEDASASACCMSVQTGIDLHCIISVLFAVPVRS